MCTLIVGHRIDDDTPLIVGANRDEELNRPSSPPQVRSAGERRILAPRDERAGGTWIGLNDSGVFAGLTNRFGGTLDRDRTSRGALVERTLKYESATEAAADLADLDPATYNGFHLIVADGETAHLVASDGELATTTPLAPGFAVLTERSLGAADNPRKRSIRDELAERDEVDLDVLREILTRCEEGSIDAVCIALEEIDYGTRSSTLIRRDSSGTVFHHADGPPCDTDYEDLSELVANLESDAS